MVTVPREWPMVAIKVFTGHGLRRQIQRQVFGDTQLFSATPQLIHPVGDGTFQKPVPLDHPASLSKAL